MDPCLFWKNFADVSLPNPAEELADEELKKLVNHLEACEPCGEAAMQLFGLLEKMIEDPESINLPDDPAAAERAFHLNIMIMMFIDPGRLNEP